MSKEPLLMNSVTMQKNSGSLQMPKIDLYNVVKSGLVEHLSFLQQAVPLSETQPEKTCSYVNRRKGYMTLAQLMG